MYRRFFGFREPPFRITPDPRFLYLGPGYREAADALTEGITRRAGFLTLVGEVGTGKTTLVRHLLESLPETVRTILVLHPTVTFDETLDHLLLELGIPVEGAGKLVLLQRLHEFVYEHTHAGGNVAIIFDEAQALEPSALAELQLLADLATDDGRPGLQVLLAGQPELEEKLRAPELMRLRERIAVEVRLNPLLPEEVRAYVQARIEHAGGAGTGPFTDAALARVAELSGGTPRVVNVLCDATLVAAYAGGVREIPASLVDEAWVDFDPSRELPPPPVLGLRPRPPEPEEPAAPLAVAAPAPAAAAAPAEPSGTPAPRRSSDLPLWGAGIGAFAGLALWALTGGADHLRTALFPAPPPAGHLLTMRVVPTSSPATDPLPTGPPAEDPPAPVTRPERDTEADTPATTTTVPAPTDPAAAAEPPAPADFPPPPAPEPRPTAAEALALVDQFRSAYETRDAARIRALFASDAADEARRRLAALPADAAEIAYLQPSADVEPSDDGVAVRAPFVIAWREADGDRGEARGTAAFEIARRDGGARIVGLEWALATTPPAPGR